MASLSAASRRPGTPTTWSRSSLGDEIVFTGDTLFKDAVGGGDPARVRSSVMDVFMALPDAMRVLPGHTDETTIGREREHNPSARRSGSTGSRDSSFAFSSAPRVDALVLLPLGTKA